MAIKILARKFCRVFYFIILIICIGQILPPPESYINYNLTTKLALCISDNESAESMYVAYSYIDWFVMLVIVTPLYILTMKLIKKSRRK